MSVGARAFLQKPWNDDELLAIIGRLLGQPAGSASQPEGSAIPEVIDR